MLGAGLAVALAVAATGILVLWPDAEKGQETERAATEPGASSRAAAAAEGIDFEAELGVVLPLALVSAEGGEAGGDSHHIGKIVSLVIERDESWRMSWVSATGPESELSIGSTPKWTSPAVAAWATAVKLGSGTRSAPSGNSRSHAAALCAPSRPG